MANWNRKVPFRVGGPIIEPIDFVGRRKLLKNISHSMHNLQNVSLHGERRIGKTSLLLYLAHNKTASILGLPRNHIPVYFDFQAFVETDMHTLWIAIAEAIAQKIIERYSDKEDVANQFLTMVNERLKDSKASESIKNSFDYALFSLENMGFIIHLLFDEFELTANNPRLGDQFYSSLRGLTVRVKNLSYVIATRTGLAAMQPDQNKFSSPFFNIFTSETLDIFTEYDVKNLIFDYFSRSDLDKSLTEKEALAEKLWAERDFLHDVTGYHPFFLQTLCYHLYNNLDNPDWPLGRAKQEALKAFKKDADPHFQYYWQHSSKAQQDIIKELAIKRPGEWPSLKPTKSLTTLEERGLVVKARDASRKWQLVSSYFNEWVNETIFPFEDPLADFVIITPTETDLEAVLSKLPKYRRVLPSPEDIQIYYATELPVTFPDGSQGLYRLIIMSLIGVGRVQAMAATQDAIRRWNPRYVVLVGVAAGIATSGIKLGDVLISDQVIDYSLVTQSYSSDTLDLDLRGSYVDQRLLGAVRNFLDTDWQDLIHLKRPYKGHPGRHIGAVLSGARVKDINVLLTKYSNPNMWPRLNGVEMEASGVISALFGTAKPQGFLSIHGISDFVDEHKSDGKWKVYASDVAASYTIAFLMSGPVPLSPRLLSPSKSEIGFKQRPNNLDLPLPGGIIPISSKFYIERAADKECGRLISQREATSLFIEAPRQTGKSSLLYRALTFAELTQAKKSVLVDLQVFPEKYFHQEEDFFKEFCLVIGDKLGIKEAIDTYWRGRRASIFNCTKYLSEYIIPQVGIPLILAIDQLERMGDSPFRSDFFGMLRTWHNNRAFDENFTKLSLFLSSAVDGYFLIDNPNQSPFNVALHVHLSDFTVDAVNKLNKLYNMLLTREETQRLMYLINGHPYLTNLTFYLLATDSTITFDDLLKKATYDTGPFGEHLSYYALQFSQHPELKQTLTDIYRGRNYQDIRAFYRLKEMGIVKQEGNKIVLRNELYLQYFKERFDIDY